MRLVYHVHASIPAETDSKGDDTEVDFTFFRLAMIIVPEIYTLFWLSVSVPVVPAFLVFHLPDGVPVLKYYGLTCMNAHLFQFRTLQTEPLSL